MLLYGASGHAKVIISCLKATEVKVLGIFDDDLTKKNLWTIPVIGSYDTNYLPNAPLIIAIGINAIRQKIARLVEHRFSMVIHPSAIVDESVAIGEGTVIFHNAVVQADTHIGKHVIINTSTSIDHDCTIADFVHIAPNATLCGGISVGEGTLIGAGSVVAPNLHIGKNCLIAAGAVVTTNIPDFAIVRGNPGRIIKRLND